jgi:phosphate starvation-inducible PhoH-like protein
MSESPTQMAVEEYFRNKMMTPKTQGQEDLVDAMNESDIILCAGPAGTGKTHLSLGLAVKYLQQNRVKRVYLIRPLQECGRPIGFFPGDKKEKLDPHMVAFYDLFGKFLNKHELNKYIAEGKIVIESPEFLRGLTLEDTFIVIDEAQNLEKKQLIMLLTRFGNGSKMVVLGDTDQCDLPERLMIGSKCPFKWIIERLEDVDDAIEIVELDERDIVRSDLVGKILKATRYNV